MKLKEYFDKEHVIISRFAKSHKISHTTIYNIMKGHPVSFCIADKVYKATKGKVSVMELLEGKSKV